MADAVIECKDEVELDKKLERMYANLDDVQLVSALRSLMSGPVLDQAKRNCPVRTGETRDSLTAYQLGNTCSIEGNEASYYVEYGHTTTRGNVVAGAYMVSQALEDYREDITDLLFEMALRGLTG